MGFVFSCGLYSQYLCTCAMNMAYACEFPVFGAPYALPTYIFPGWGGRGMCSLAKDCVFSKI